MKKILLSVVLILFGITTQLTAQVNGTAARPLVSTAEKPVYYYIENQSATTGYTGNVLLPGTAVGQKLRHLPMPTDVESAMWQLVNESGTVKLKNKLTGYYMSVSHTCAASGDVFEVNKYEGLTYYKIRSGRQTPTLAHNNNLCDRQSPETDKLHWYFIVAPESDANYQELIATNSTSYFTDFGTYGRSDNGRKLNSLSFTAAQNTTLAINQATAQYSSPVYFDKTTQIIEVVPGSNLSVSFNWTGAWMRNIAYVDWNNDKLFSTTDATERIGYNALAESGNEMTKSITYAVPAGQAPGDYRMRIMVDWFENHSSPNEAKFELLGNGGSVVDVILRVLPVPTLSFGTSNLIVNGDVFTITPPAGATTVKYTTDNTDPVTSPTAVTGTSVTATGNFKLRAISVKDGVNSLELVRDIKTIDLTLGNEYYIVFQRTGTSVNPTLALEDKGNGVAMQTQTLEYGKTVQRWTVSKGATDGLYKLTSIAGNIMYYNGSKFTVSATPAVDAQVDMRFITFAGTSGYTQYSGFEIQRKNSTTMGMNPIGGSAVGKEIGEWNNGDGGNALKFMNTKGLLLTEIQKTQAICDGAITGSDFGQTPASSKVDLQTAISNAQLEYEKSTSEGDLTAITSLRTAVTTYISTINTDKNSLLSTDNSKYKWYTIRSTGTATYVANKVISSNGRILTNKFTFENAGTPVTDAQLFRFEISGSEIIIINKANGYYMATDGAISSTSATFALNLLTDGYSFNIKPASANAIHAQEAGSTIVNWAGDAGSASAWVFDYQKTTPKVPEFSGTGNWSDAANWVDNALPDAYNDVIINGIGEAVLDVDATVKAVTINSGKTLTISPTKKLQVSGKIDNSVGTLNVNGVLQLNTGGWVTNAPVYGTASELIYNTGGTYGRGAEWNTTSPSSLQLYNNTTLNYPNSSTPNLTLTGNLTIDNGSALYMDYSSGSGKLTVGGNVTLNGNLSLGSAIGGDILVGGNWTKASTSTFNANNRAVIFNGTTEQTVTNDGGTYPYVVIEGGSKVTLATGKTWEVTNLTINSDATKGTGTFVNNGTLTNTTANVNQALTYRTWYMSSPVASASPAGSFVIRSYDETTDNWDAATLPMVFGKGYSVTPPELNPPTNILFTGALNTGEKSIVLTKGTTSQAGFNFVGNPYPSYIDWKAMVTKNSAVLETNTMWYRSKIEGKFKFYTVDGAGIVVPSTSPSITAFVPPMQGFWVKTNTDGSTLYFEDNMRSHAGTVANPSPNPLKAPAATQSELSLLRLQVSNGTNTDEAVIYSYANATDGYDFYDSPKMMNSDAAIPEIYTSLNNQPIVINVMKSLPLDTEIGLAFVPGEATSFSLRASEITNLPSDVKVILKDYANNGQETDLTDGAAVYNFTPATTTGDRFSVIFRSAGSTTAVNTNSSKGISVYSMKNGINVTVNAELVENATLRVFNAVGQQLVNQHLTNRSTTINGNFNPGVYVVKVSNGTANTTQKIVIK